LDFRSKRGKKGRGYPTSVPDIHFCGAREGGGLTCAAAGAGKREKGRGGVPSDYSLRDQTLAEIQGHGQLRGEEESSLFSPSHEGEKKGGGGLVHISTLSNV